VSNLGSLPQIPAGTEISIVSNADWLDQFYVQSPGFPGQPLAIGGNLLNLSTTITVSSTAGIVPGSLVAGYGIPPGDTVAAVVDNQTLTLAQWATVTATNVNLYVWGPALDLTGITFKSTVRLTPQSTTVLLIASTQNGLMINSGTIGAFGWNVPAAKLPNWPIGLTRVGLLTGVVDIQASDASGSIVNMCALSGPLPLSVVLPETR
jgi:hypothetical protein